MQKNSDTKMKTGVWMVLDRGQVAILEENPRDHVVSSHRYTESQIATLADEPNVYFDEPYAREPGDMIAAAAQDSPAALRLLAAWDLDAEKQWEIFDAEMPLARYTEIMGDGELLALERDFREREKRELAESNAHERASRD